jgi:hypothetical protein
MANATLSRNNPSFYIATGAAAWASYLINGDASGLTDEERDLADQWCERELGPNGAVVDCGEPWFTWSYRLYTGAPYQGGDVVDARSTKARQRQQRSYHCRGR